jgi:hypothetical protein
MGERKPFQETAKTVQAPETITFCEAVEMAKCYLESERFQDGHDRYHWQGEYQHAATKIAPMLLRNYSEYFNENNPLHYDTLRHAFAQRIEDGEPIPSEFRQLASAIMSGERSKPKRTSGAKEVHFLHSRIVWAVDLLIQSGLTATRNDTSKHVSACDAVAEALRQLGLKPLSFNGVKRIWLDGRWIVAVARQFDELSLHE